MDAICPDAANAARIGSAGWLIQQFLRGFCLNHPLLGGEEQIRLGTIRTAEYKLRPFSYPFHNVPHLAAVGSSSVCYDPVASHAPSIVTSAVCLGYLSGILGMPPDPELVASDESLETELSGSAEFRHDVFFDSGSCSEI